MKKSILTIILVLCMVLSSPLTSGMAVTEEVSILNSGTCGEKLIWALDSSGILTISGTGEMNNYHHFSGNSSPWYNQRANITSVVIMPGVTSIGEEAFHNCYRLANVTISDSVTSIGDGAFLACAGLVNFYVDAQNSYYTAVEGILLNKDRTILICYPAGKSNACYNILDNVTRIEDFAFYGCLKLKSISIPESVLCIGGSAFSQSGLTSVLIPSSVNDIGETAFWNCKDLTKVLISNGVQRIGESAFRFCGNLTNITIPSSVTSIGDGALGACSKLSEITIDPDNLCYTSIDGVLFNKRKTSLLCFPAGKQCTYYNIPASVSNIGDGAFWNCNCLESVAVPDTVIEIGPNVFWNCESLTNIYYGGTTEQWENISIKLPNDLLLSTTIHFNNKGAESYRIQIYANKPMTALRPGDYIDFRCTLYDGSNQEINWTNPSVVVDTPDILQISGYYNEGSNCYFTVKGEEEGTCTFTVTDSATGVYGKFSLSFGNGIVSADSYRLDRVPSFQVDESAWLFGEKYTQTNFYDVSGLFVNGFSYSYDEEAEEYDISFNAYNRSYYYGAVDIYDASGRWISTKKIDKAGSAHSIQDAFKDGWNLIADLAVEKKGLSYTLNSSTKETPIRFSVPAGGYFTISNNLAESPGTYMYNMIDYILLGFNAALDAGLDVVKGDIKVSKIQDLVIKKFEDKALSLSMIGDSLTDELKSYGVNAAAAAGQYSLSEFASVSACSFEELLEACDIDIEKIVKVELNLAEGVFTKLSGPVGAYLSAMFSGAKYLDIITQTIGLSTSTDNPYIVIYAMEAGDSPVATSVNGVTVEADKGVIDDESLLQVFKIRFDGNVPEADSSPVPDGQYQTYNIRFVKNGVEVQPNGEVTVKISIPDGYKNESCIVLRQEEAGSWTQLNAVIEGNVISFKTTHFSIYAIADLSCPASSITLNEPELSLTAGASHYLSYNLTPQDASKASLIWTSSNPLVAYVNQQGRVSGASAGTAVITVTTPDGYSDVCNVTVEGTAISVEQWTPGGSSVKLADPGRILQLSPQILAVRYKNGRMMQASFGAIISDSNVVFPHSLASGDKTFFLDSEAFIPLVKPAILVE